MIAITLNFTSIEAAVRALREIPENLLVNHAATLVAEPEAPAPKAPKAAKAAKPAPEQEVAPPQATAPAEEAPAPAAAPAEPEPAPVASSVDYPTLQKAVFALAGKSREAAAAVVQSFGVKTFKELPQDKWAEALGAVTEKLAELEAA